MKKFFSFVCATAIAISASAFTPMARQNVSEFKQLSAPAAPAKSHAAMASKDEMKLAEPAFLAMQKMEKPAELANLKMETPVRKAIQAIAGAKHAPAATQDYTPTAPTLAQAYSYNSIYGDGSWNINLFGGTDTSFVGGLSLAGPSTAISIAGTYATNDSNCYVYFVRAAGDTLISCLSNENFTISYVSEQTDGNTVYTTYHISGDLTVYSSTISNPTMADVETLHLDFNFVLGDLIVDYYYYYYFSTYYYYYQQTGTYAYYYYAMQYYNNMFITLEDQPVVVKNDTVNFSDPKGLMPDIVYYSDYSLNRMIFRNQAAVDSGKNLKIYAAVYFEGAKMADGSYDLTQGTYNTYNTINVIYGTDTSTLSLNFNQASTLTISQGADGKQYIDLYMAMRDGKVYHTTNQYFVSTTESPDTLNCKYYYDSGWKAGTDVDTSYYRSDDQDVSFTSYVLENNGTSYTKMIGIGLDIAVNGDSTFVSDYTEDDLIGMGQYTYVYDYMDSTQYSIYYADISISDEDGDGWGDHITGALTLNDGLVHPFTMEFENPFKPVEPTGDTIYIDLGRVKVKYYSSTKDYYIQGEGTDYSGAIDVFSDDSISAVGTYTTADFDEEYTYLYQGNTEIELYKAISAEITAGTADTTYNIHAQLLGKDGIVYDLTMKDYAIHALDTITITVPATSAVVQDYTANKGYFIVAGYGNSREYYCQGGFWGSSISGTYNQDSSIYYYGSYTYLLHIVGTDTTQIYFDDTFTYTGSLNGSTLTATLQGLGEDSHYYIISYTITKIYTDVEEEKAEEEKKASKILKDGQVIILKGGKKYNLFGQEIE